MTDALPAAAPGSATLVAPAAGLGRRLGGARKQFRLLGDAPLLIQTLRAFRSRPAIAGAVVAAPSEDLEAVRALLAAYGLGAWATVCAGGPTRQQSVRRALEATPPEIPLVLVHDAVRPFAGAALIDAVVRAAAQWGAAAPGVPVADTMRRAAGGVFTETVPREDLYAMQTPQGFRREALLRALRRAEGADYTDDAEAAARSGLAVRLVPGDPDNFKVTTPADWTRALEVWARRAEAARTAD